MVMAMVMDSAGSMHGEKSWLEVCISDLAPHLLDTDRDSCHQIHNIVKNFTFYVVGFLRDYFATSAQTLDTLLTHLKV